MGAGSAAILFLANASRAQVRASSPADFPSFTAGQIELTYDARGSEEIVGRQTVDQQPDGTLTITRPVSWLGNLVHTRRVIHRNGTVEAFFGLVPVKLNFGASVESPASLQRALGKIPENCIIQPSEEQVVGTASLLGMPVLRVQRSSNGSRIITSKSPAIGCFALERTIFSSSSELPRTTRKTIAFDLHTERRTSYGRKEME
jgi:hypothetical protein